MNEDKQTQLVRKLYTTVFGRLLLRILIRPWVSRLAGAFMDSRLSKVMIRGFIKKNNIDMSCCENAREYFVLYSDNFDDILMVQVGALLVGRICNQHKEAVVQRGQTAGWFEYGGSTVILCLKSGIAEILPEIRDDAENGEVKVKMGRRIGRYQSRGGHHDSEQRTKLQI